MFTDVLIQAATHIISEMRERGLRLCAAESCTGGLICALFTEIPGSSDVFERGFVTYSNASKSQLVNVPAPLIEQFGAVSEPVARAMAEGALDAAQVDIAVAVTGVAGPGGGSPEKPVGLVHFAAAFKGETVHRVKQFGALSRSEIRLASVQEALDLVRSILDDHPLVEQP